MKPLEIITVDSTDKKTIKIEQQFYTQQTPQQSHNTKLKNLLTNPN